MGIDYAVMSTYVGDSVVAHQPAIIHARPRRGACRISCRRGVGPVLARIIGNALDVLGLDIT